MIGSESEQQLLDRYQTHLGAHQSHADSDRCFTCGQTYPCDLARASMHVLSLLSLVGLFRSSRAAIESGVRS